MGPEAGSLQHPWLSLVNQVGGSGLASESITANGARSQEPGVEKQLASMNSELVLPSSGSLLIRPGDTQGGMQECSVLPVPPTLSTSLCHPDFDILYKDFQSDSMSFQREKEL